MSVEAVACVYAVTEMPMSGEDREEVHGTFTDLAMAMVMFNALVEKQSGRGRYYTGSDVCRGEPEDGRGGAYAVQRLPLTCRPGMAVVEVGKTPTYGNMSPKALEAWDRAARKAEPV